MLRNWSKILPFFLVKKYASEKALSVTIGGQKTKVVEVYKNVFLVEITK